MNRNGAQNVAAASGTMFSRATSNGRRMNKSMQPTNSITFGKVTNSGSVRRGGELSRRSMSVTHQRGKELEDTSSPSRLSRIMSSRDWLGGEHHQHRGEGIETAPLNQKVRNASVSSMKNNRLLDHKASIISRMSQGDDSHQDQDSS